MKKGKPVQHLVRDIMYAELVLRVKPVCFTVSDYIIQERNAAGTVWCKPVIKFDVHTLYAVLFSIWCILQHSVRELTQASRN